MLYDDTKTPGDGSFCFRVDSRSVSCLPIRSSRLRQCFGGQAERAEEGTFVY